MLKNRPFLKGLGSGLIIGALLLQIMIMVRNTENRINQPNQTADVPITAKLVREKADELNLKVFDKSEKVYDQKQLDEAVNKAVEAAKSGMGTPAPEAPAVKQVTVYIIPGMPAVNIVDMLYNTGVIVDRQGFEQAINQGQYASKIRSGLYTFNLNEPIPDVITKITTPSPR